MGNDNEKHDVAGPQLASCLRSPLMLRNVEDEKLNVTLNRNHKNFELSVNFLLEGGGNFMTP